MLYKPTKGHLPVMLPTYRDRNVTSIVVQWLTFLTHCEKLQVQYLGRLDCLVNRKFELHFEKIYNAGNLVHKHKYKHMSMLCLCAYSNLYGNDTREGDI